MWALALLSLGLVIWGGFLAWRWKMARDFAPELFASRKATGEVPDDVSEAEFVDLYLRGEGPRAGTYLFACATFILVTIAPVSAIFNGVWTAMWRAAGAPPVFELGTLVHTFGFFVFMMLLMIGVLAFALRRYYALMPPGLKQILRNLKETP